VEDRQDARKVANFSDKEKDEASLNRGCGSGFAECLRSPICRGEGLLFFWVERSWNGPFPALVSQPQQRFADVFAERNH
jgi:hypothetical protein